MSELAAILARRRRISDGNFLRQDKPVERDEEGDNVRNNDNNDNKNDDRNNNKEEETIIFPPPTPPPTPPPIVQIELDNNDLNSIDDLRKLAAETDNMAAEVLEKDNTDDKSTIDNNSTKNILRSPAWQPGDDKAAFEDSIKSTGGFITSSVVEVNQLKLGWWPCFLFPVSIDDHHHGHPSVAQRFLSRATVREGDSSGS